ncbi:MAG: sensor domain-containing diguanylate cyclase [Lachnospiraceae bacterium]|nr:sensor domain-containing diguanylate cyclase [Lachnospiraceae bacterium]
MKKLLMLQTKNKKYRRMIILAAVVCFLLLLLLYIGILHNDIAAERERYNYIARNEAEHIITLVDCVMARTSTLKALVQDNDGETEWFDKVAGDLYEAVIEETGVSLKNFALAPDGVVSDVYPLEGNEKLVGFNFMDTSKKGNAEAKEAYEKGKTLLTNPFELVQGGVGMGGRSPVILKDEDGERLWGLVTVTIDFENLVDVLYLQNLEGMGIECAISYIDQDGRPNRMYAIGDPGKHSVSYRFGVRNLTWQIDVAPEKGWITPWRVGISLVIILVLSVLGGIIANMVIVLHENNAMLRMLSVTDGLTGCLNRMAYEKKIDEISADGFGEDYIYISADVNGLKQCNDTLGHPAGDELLVGTSSCMKEAFSPYGELYRIGGDEFAAMIRTDKETLDTAVKQARDLIAKWKGVTVKESSVSFGYAMHSEFPDATIEQLIKLADDRMYEEKRVYYQDHTR